jgi:hypothetical protein
MASITFYSTSTRQDSTSRLTKPYKDTQPTNASTACDYLALYMHFQVLKVVLSL